MNEIIFYLATSDGPVVVRWKDGRARATLPMKLEATADEDSIHAALAHRPERPERVYYSLPEQGAWRSDDYGDTWRPVFRELPQDRVTALTMDGEGRVYAGTEPSRLYVSNDAGESWEACEGMQELPSSSDWSFPPRPESHHVRWIHPEPANSRSLRVAIEAGALVSSPDGGSTWRDCVPGSPYDTHQLAIHPERPGHILSAAGDGVFESRDGGASWFQIEEGLPYSYGWSVAIDPGDPEAAVLSVAPGPREAHSERHAESALFRREKRGRWVAIENGLPNRKGSLAAFLATHPSEPGVFHAAIGRRLYRSADAGRNWRAVDFECPKGFDTPRIHAMAVAVAP